MVETLMSQELLRERTGLTREERLVFALGGAEYLPGLESGVVGQ